MDKYSMASRLFPVVILYMLSAVYQQANCEDSVKDNIMNGNRSEKIAEANSAVQKFKIFAAQPSKAAGDKSHLPVEVTVTNTSKTAGEFYRSSLIGITINGVKNNYNMNLHFEYILEGKVVIPSNEEYRFIINLRDFWQESAVKSASGYYQVILRYEIEGDIYKSNEFVIYLN